VLGNGDILSFHLVGDVGEFGFLEALEDSSVGVGVKHGRRSSLLARHSVLVGSIGLSWGHFQHIAPLGSQLTKAGHTEGQDSVDDLVQYPGFHSFVAYPRRDSSYVTDVTHKFMMQLCRHQMSPRRLVPEAFQEHKPKCLRTPRRRCQVGVMHARCLLQSTTNT
jgi:hypothetical protein